MSISLPKIILQQWLDFSAMESNDYSVSTKPIPEHWESSVESIYRLMPSWKYVQMENSMAISLLNKFPDFIDTYNSLEYPIMKVDSLRYMWLYIYGGIYMDMDIELTKPLDELFIEGDFTNGSPSDLYLVKSGNTKSIYTNSFLASRRKCTFWLECLEEIKKPYASWMIGKHLKVMGKTGPLMLSRVVQRTRGKYTICELPNKKLMPCSLCDPKPCTKPDAYTRALEGSSWCGWDSNMFAMCICNWKYIALFVIILIVILMWWYLSGCK